MSNAAQESLSEVDIRIVKADLNAKVGSDNTFIGHAMGKHGDHNGNGESFAVFCSFHCILIATTLFEYTVWHKAS